jgi:proline dehydrogenase
LDYSVEGKEEEEQFDAALEMTLKTIEFAKSAWLFFCSI